MSERYSRLLKKDCRLYTAGSPVLIEAYALLLDNESGNLLAQVKCTNIGEKTVSAVSVSVLAFKADGTHLRGVESFLLTGLGAQRGESFGQKAAIPMPDAATRAISVRVAECIFDDGTIWQAASDAVWEPIPEQEEAAAHFNNPELLKQYMLSAGSKMARYMSMRYRDLIICSCGAIARDGEAVCYRCGQRFDRLFALTDERLAADCKARLAKEKAEREEAESARLAREKAEAEEQQKRQQAAREAAQKRMEKLKRLALPAAILLAAALLLIFAVVKVGVPTLRYRKAVDLMEDERYEEAIDIFRKLSDYKDSEELLASCTDSILRRDAAQGLEPSEAATQFKQFLLDRTEDETYLDGITSFGLCDLTGDAVDELIVLRNCEACEAWKATADGPQLMVEIPLTDELSHNYLYAVDLADRTYLLLLEQHWHYNENVDYLDYVFTNAAYHFVDPISQVEYVYECTITGDGTEGPLAPRSLNPQPELISSRDDFVTGIPLVSAVTSAGGFSLDDVLALLDIRITQNTRASSAPFDPWDYEGPYSAAESRENLSIEYAEYVGAQNVCFSYEAVGLTRLSYIYAVFDPSSGYAVFNDYDEQGRSVAGWLQFIQDEQNPPGAIRLHITSSAISGLDAGHESVFTPGLYTPEPVYINELPIADKYGKIWMMHDAPAPVGTHTDVSSDAAAKDYITQGYSSGPVYDYLGNLYTYGLHVDGYEYAAYYVSYDIGGAYSQFSGTYCMSPDLLGDRAAKNTKYFEIYGDGQLLFRSNTVTQGSMPQNFSVDVTGIRILTIYYPKTSGPSRIATIYDGRLI